MNFGCCFPRGPLSPLSTSSVHVILNNNSFFPEENDFLCCINIQTGYARPVEGSICEWKHDVRRIINKFNVSRRAEEKSLRSSPKVTALSRFFCVHFFQSFVVCLILSKPNSDTFGKLGTTEMV